ncbi:MAG: V-type ATP synthase subunit E [Clostridia bacterium]|nr:V-type ATP synthase subunit E [Clostridia bacterium]
MEIQLGELIDQIKKDGVEAAELEAAAILDNAKKEAEGIIADAEAKADKMIADAKAENERMLSSSEDAIKQAGRNLLISFRESVARELRAVTEFKVGEVYSSEQLASLVVNTVEAWAKKPDTEELTLILNTEDLKALEDSLLAALKDRMLEGITLKANDNFDGGFRIAVNDTGAYYDYSTEAVVDMLSGYLSPKVTSLLKEAQ